MAIISPDQLTGARSVPVALVSHIAKVWHDPSFRTALKRESWRFAKAVFDEALAASQRVRG